MFCYSRLFCPILLQFLFCLPLSVAVFSQWDGKILQRLQRACAQSHFRNVYFCVTSEFSDQFHSRRAIANKWLLAFPYICIYINVLRVYTPDIVVSRLLRINLRSMHARQTMFTFSHTSICEMVANFTHAECVIKTAHSKIYKHLNQHSLFLLSLLHCLVARYGYLSRHIMYSFQMEIFCQNTKHILQRLLPCQNNTLYIKKPGGQSIQAFQFLLACVVHCWASRNVSPKLVR